MNDTLVYGFILMVVVGASVIGVIMVPAQTTQILGFGALIATSLFGVLNTKRTEQKVEKLAANVDSVKSTGEAVHTLTNSNMGVQLKLNAELSRWKAVETGHPVDITAAEEAERMYADHQRKQGIVDAGPTPGSPPQRINPTASDALVTSVQAMETALVEGVKNMQVTAETVVVEETGSKKRPPKGPEKP